MGDPNLHGFYLFGLTFSTSSPTPDEDKQQSRKDNAKTMSVLMTTLRAFESNIQQNSRYYDPVDTFVSVTNTRFSQLPPDTVLDTHNWSDNGFDNENDSSDSSDEDEGGTDAADFAQEGILSTSASKFPPKKKQGKTKTTGHLPTSKLSVKSINSISHI